MSDWQRWFEIELVSLQARVTKLETGDLVNWRCHLCDELRPTGKIGVYKRDVSDHFGSPPGLVTENIRYCIDKPDCRTKVLTFSFVLGKK